MSSADILIFQNIIFALIGILNPWPSLDSDTKAAFIEKSLNASIQIMRSYNIETVYENLEIDTYRDLVSLQGLQFKYYITTENELCSYEDMHTEAYANFEDYLGCPINISLDSLDIEGLLSIDKKKISEDIVYNQIPEWDSIGHMALISALEEMISPPVGKSGAIINCIIF